MQTLTVPGVHDTLKVAYRQHEKCRRMKQILLAYAENRQQGARKVGWETKIQKHHVDVVLVINQ